MTGLVRAAILVALLVGMSGCSAESLDPVPETSTPIPPALADIVAGSQSRDSAEPDAPALASPSRSLGTGDRKAASTVRPVSPVAPPTAPPTAAPDRSVPRPEPDPAPVSVRTEVSPATPAQSQPSPVPSPSPRPSATPSPSASPSETAAQPSAEPQPGDELGSGPTLAEPPGRDTGDPNRPTNPAQTPLVGA